MSINKRATIDAIDRAYMRAASSDIFIEDLPYVVFNIFDRAFFAQKLKDMVYLGWFNGEPSLPGRTCAPGVKQSRITIQLNRAAATAERWGPADTMANLIHQMIHAYFLVCCGPPAKDTKCDGRLLDGRQFGILAGRIRELSGLSTPGYLPLHLHPLPETRRPRELTNTSRELFSPKTVEATPLRNDITHCSRDNRDITVRSCLAFLEKEYGAALEEACDKRGDHVYKISDSGLTQVHRLTEAPPSAQYVELLWNDKRIMLPSAKLLAYPSMAGKGRTIAVPGSTTETTLRCLHAFVETGKYKPDLPIPLLPPSTVPSASATNASTAPVLADPRPEAPDYILTDLTIHALASALSFTELAAHALLRLHTLPSTHSPPLPALTLIYDAPSPSESLRRWTRAFLTTRGGGGGGAPNLWKLARRYAEGYTALYHRSPLFKEDVDIAAATLTAQALSASYSRAAAPTYADYYAPAAYGQPAMAALPPPALASPFGDYGYPSPPPSPRSSLLPPLLSAPPLTLSAPPALASSALALPGLLPAVPGLLPAVPSIGAGAGAVPGVGGGWTKTRRTPLGWEVTNFETGETMVWDEAGGREWVPLVVGSGGGRAPRGGRGRGSMWDEGVWF
ncbi:hypothetical protein M8818_000563 [Zalaria obscura]|uniref:Uncharacterized protein n=1 Tax=Zalaria obscura TaxID=2024903 RepID=A0ACC3SNS8_9PEZI